MPLRICTTCKEEYNLSYYSTWCRACHNKYLKEYRKRKPQKQYPINKQLKKTRQAYVQEYINNLKLKPCTDCGVVYPSYVMDFDHVRGEKKFTLAYGKNWSLNKVLEELSKCELVCANCHRERTHNARNPINR